MSALSSKVLARDAKKTTRGAGRDIEREIMALDRQEKVLIADMRKAAVQQRNSLQSATLQAYAKQLVQLRASRTRLARIKTHVASAGMSATTMAAQAGAVEALGKTAGVMARVNTQVGGARGAGKAAAAAFAAQLEVLNLNTEALDDFLEDALGLGGSDEEAEAAGVVAATLAEIGVGLGAAMTEAPVGTPAGAAGAARIAGATDQARKMAQAGGEAAEAQADVGAGAVSLEARLAALS